MPVQVQCISVVIRNEALDRCLEGGAASFSEIAPNAMSYGGDRISQASFMSAIDAEEFVKLLELRGLDRSTDDPDFTLVNVADKSMDPACDWLILFDYDERTIATVRGSTSRTVIAPADDGHRTVRQLTNEEIERDYEFVERKDGVDVYREKSTGKLLYHARRTESPHEIFEAASRIVWRHRRHPGQPPLTLSTSAELTGAVEKLQGLAARNPDSPDIAFYLGLAWCALGNFNHSYQWFSRASQLEPEQTAYLKEWAGACLSEGEFDTALRLGEKAVSCVPDDPDLLANLAVIQLLNGHPAEALKAISRAVELNQDDPINLHILGIATDVHAGKRPCPTSLQEMERKPNLLSKLKWSMARWFRPGRN